MPRNAGHSSKKECQGAQRRCLCAPQCGRKLWKNWSAYHRRSLVETKMNCIKRLGERGMSRTFERQVNELHIRAAILNQFTELGCPQTVAVA